MTQTNVNAVSTLSGFFKTVYAKTVKQAIPDNCKIQKELIQFSEPVQQVGEQYLQPVTMKLPHGFTFASNNQDAFALNPAQAGLTVKALVTANQIVLRDAISYEAASLATSSETSFGKVTAHVVKRMLESARIRAEILMLYGGGASPSTASSDPISSGHMGQVGASPVTGANGTFAVPATQWATGLWCGSEGMVLDTYTRAGTQVAANMKVTGVNPDTKTITVDNLPAGTTGSNTLGSGDYVWFAGGRANCMAGIHDIMVNTGTMFNVSASSYNQWKANTTSAGGALTFAISMGLIEKAVNKGLMGDATLLVNSGAWRNMMTTEAALRRYNWGYDGKVFEEGAEEIKFHGQNGVLTIIPHPFVREGYAYLIKPEDWIRVGSVDWTFEMPGSEKGRFFRDLENNAGFELRLYTNQAIFCEIPGHQAMAYAIANS